VGKELGIPAVTLGNAVIKDKSVRGKTIPFPTFKELLIVVFEEASMNDGLLAIELLLELLTILICALEKNKPAQSAIGDKICFICNFRFY